MRRLNKCIRRLLSLLQYGKQIQQASPTGQQPPLKTPEEWRTYWQMRGQPWRTEPEIDTARQAQLSQCRTIAPDIKQGIYPFKGIEPKLARADIEWLLATHEKGRGPVDWSDKSQRDRDGLDMRGADLRRIDLSDLPLACLRGGLTFTERLEATVKQRNIAAAHLEGADLRRTELSGACLNETHLERADLSGAYLDGTFLSEAYLERADLSGAHLEGASLWLFDGNGVGPFFADVQWHDVNLVALTDKQWRNLKMLGEENTARKRQDRDGNIKGKNTQLEEYQTAVRANRQLAAALQAQGLNEDAVGFAYRAWVLQKHVLWLQMTERGVSFRERSQALGSWLFSWFLFLLAGYGYRPVRSVLWYLVIILGFALAYHTFGHLSLWPPDAFVYSLTSFHGRVFFSDLEHTTSLHDTLIILAALEAVVGLFIEISFIATFTGRFLGK